MRAGSTAPKTPPSRRKHTGSPSAWKNGNSSRRKKRFSTPRSSSLQDEYPYVPAAEDRYRGFALNDGYGTLRAEGHILGDEDGDFPLDVKQWLVPPQLPSDASADAQHLVHKNLVYCPHGVVPADDKTIADSEYQVDVDAFFDPCVSSGQLQPIAREFGYQLLLDDAPLTVKEEQSGPKRATRNKKKASQEEEEPSSNLVSVSCLTLNPAQRHVLLHSGACVLQATSFTAQDNSLQSISSKMMKNFSPDRQPTPLDFLPTFGSMAERAAEEPSTDADTAISKRRKLEAMPEPAPVLRRSSRKGTKSKVTNGTRKEASANRVEPVDHGSLDGTIEALEKTLGGVQLSNASLLRELCDALPTTFEKACEIERKTMEWRLLAAYEKMAAVRREHLLHMHIGEGESHGKEHRALRAREESRDVARAARVEALRKASHRSISNLTRTLDVLSYLADSDQFRVSSPKATASSPEASRSGDEM